MYLSLAYIFSIILSLAASLSVYFQRKDDSYLKWFTPFLFITLLVEGVSWFGLFNEKGNHVMYNVFSSVVEFSFYFFILGEIIKSKRVKRIIRVVLYVYVPVALGNIIFIQKFVGFPSLTYDFGCLFMVAICIYYFFELFQFPHSVALVRQPSFWICSGLLFFYCVSFPIFGPIRILSALPLVFSKNFAVIINLLNVLLYSSFTIAFLCRLRTRNSMSLS